MMKWCIRSIWKYVLVAQFGYYSCICLKRLRIAGVPAEIRTENLSNTCLQLCCYAVDMCKNVAILSYNRPFQFSSHVLQNKNIFNKKTTIDNVRKVNNCVM
jgi:hypothetical protein